MHHTLLPIQEKKILRREYRIRALIVFCFTLSLAGLLGVAALFPAFVRASFERRTNESAAAALKDASNDKVLSSIQQTVALSQKILDTLEAHSHDPVMSAVISGIVGMRGAVRFSSFSIAETSTSSLTITMQGVAPTRDDLLSFKSRVENAVPGNKVDLPASELTKSANVDFTIQVTEPIQTK